MGFNLGLCFNSTVLASSDYIAFVSKVLITSGYLKSLIQLKMHWLDVLDVVSGFWLAYGFIQRTQILSSIEMLKAPLCLQTMYIPKISENTIELGALIRTTGMS